MHIFLVSILCQKKDHPEINQDGLILFIVCFLTNNTHFIFNNNYLMIITLWLITSLLSIVSERL